MTTTLTGVNGGTFPNTAVGPAAGEAVTAASVNNPVQAVLNECKYLYDTKGALAVANTWTAKQTFDIGGGGGVGIETAADTTCTFNGEVSCKGNLLITSGSSQTVQSGAGFGIAEGATATCSDDFTFTGSPTAPARLVLGTRSRFNCPPDDLSAADHTVSATDSPIFVLAKPTGAHTITVEQATDTVKANGDTIEFWMPVPGDDPDTDYYAIKREGSANNICILWGKYLPTAGAGEAFPGFCRIYLKAGVWRLAGGAGVNFDTDA